MATPEEAQRAFLGELIGAGHLIPTGVDGLYGRGAAFEGIVSGLEGYISSFGDPDRPEVLRFPPLVTRENFEKSEYMKSFPQLAGIVHSFDGDDAGHLALLDKLEKKQDWSAGLPGAGVVLTPAACYPVYPTVARAPVPAEGRLLDVYSWCFRHEPSIDPCRMQMFRMREHVRIGSAELVKAWREVWLERGKRMMAALQLEVAIDDANDAFFGRTGRMLKMNQRDQGLKFELLVPVTSSEKPTACLSFNYHQDHFGHTFGIRLASGGLAHSACVGWGMERIALALLRRHGLDAAAWPAAVREKLTL